jgi:hypothetical protein
MGKALGGVSVSTVELKVIDADPEGQQDGHHPKHPETILRRT